MIPAKKKQGGHPAQGGVVAPEKKKTRKERSIENKLFHRKVKSAFRSKAVADVKALAGSPALKVTRTRTSPSDIPWTDELGTELYKLIVTGHSFDEIAAIEGMPPVFAMLTWLGDEEHPFCKVYNRGREMLLPLIEQRAVLAAVTPIVGEVRTTKQVYNPSTRQFDDVEEVRTFDNVERARLIADGYRWWLAVRQPRKYGRQPETADTNDSLKELLGAMRARNDALKNGEGEG